MYPPIYFCLCYLILNTRILNFGVKRFVGGGGWLCHNIIICQTPSVALEYWCLWLQNFHGNTCIYEKQPRVPLNINMHNVRPFIKNCVKICSYFIKMADNILITRWGWEEISKYQHLYSDWCREREKKLSPFFRADWIWIISGCFF